MKSTAVGEALHPQIEAPIPRLRRYARALVRDPVAADDLVQDSLARALGKIRQWHDLRAWLFTILHNQHISRARRIARERDNIELQKSDADLALSPDQTARLELRDLERAIAKLSEEQRAVILLTGLEGRDTAKSRRFLTSRSGRSVRDFPRGRETLRVLTGLSSNRHRLATKRRPVRRRPPIEKSPRTVSRTAPRSRNSRPRDELEASNGVKRGDRVILTHRRSQGWQHVQKRPSAATS